MAEEKKPAKVTGGADNRKTIEQLIFLLAGLFLLTAITTGLVNYIESFGLGTPEAIWERVTNYFFQYIWPTWKLVAAIVSALALTGIIHNSWKLRAINLEENKIYNPVISSVSDEGEVPEPKNEKWEKVLKYAYSSNSSDWRLAIIEADVMLGELLHTAGYIGESVGDMLKTVDKSEFQTVEDAWEAHKVRNAIAHSGGDFQLNERETRRTIALFEKVFKEFQVI